MSEITWFFRVSIVFLMSLIMSMASIMCMFGLIEVGEMFILLMLFMGFLAIILHLENKT